MKKKKSANSYYNARLPIEIKDRVKKYAAENNTFITEVVMEAINQFFERRDHEVRNTDQKGNTV